jgi:DNA-binding GntR family transcriptional regulator
VASWRTCSPSTDAAIAGARFAVGSSSTTSEVEQARVGQLWGSLKRRNDSRERRVSYQADHEQLVDALTARELQRAVAVMDAHLARVEANLLGAMG